MLAVFEKSSIMDAWQDHKYNIILWIKEDWFCKSTKTNFG